MTDVRLNVRKLKIQNTLDGSDKRSDEVRCWLRSQRLSSTARVDGANAISVYHKPATNKGSLENPQQGKDIGNIFGIQRRVEILTNVT